MRRVKKFNDLHLDNYILPSYGKRIKEVQDGQYLLESCALLPCDAHERMNTAVYIVDIMKSIRCQENDRNLDKLIVKSLSNGCNAHSLTSSPKAEYGRVKVLGKSQTEDQQGVGPQIFLRHSFLNLSKFRFRARISWLRNSSSSRIWFSNLRERPCAYSSASTVKYLSTVIALTDSGLGSLSLDKLCSSNEPCIVSGYVLGTCEVPGGNQTPRPNKACV